MYLSWLKYAIKFVQYSVFQLFNDFCGPNDIIYDNQQNLITIIYLFDEYN